jgi:hypothetical protein
MMADSSMTTNRTEAVAAARRIAEHLLALRTRPSTPPPSRAEPGLDYPRLQHHLRWFDGLVRLYRAAARALADQVVLGRPGEDTTAPAAAPDPLIDIVRRAHRVLLEHPVAARAAFAALAEQGRVYAATREGAGLRARLVRSHRLRRASLVWRSLTMGMLDDQDPGELPSTYLDNLIRVIDRPDLEQLLGKLQIRRVAP